jgi:hypothetical protein
MFKTKKINLKILVCSSLVSFFCSLSFAGCFVSISQSQETCERLCGRTCVREHGDKGNGWRAVDYVQPKPPLTVKKTVRK